MRVIAGSLRGREVLLPKGSRIRPATGFVREMLMSIYTPDRLAAGSFADLCAGSGLVGFEALSRGARHAVFVEAEPRTSALLKRNAERFGVDSQITVLTGDARRVAPRIAALVAEGRVSQVSALFADPPYIKGMARDLAARLSEGIQTSGATIFHEDALVIFRTVDRLEQGYSGLEYLEDRDAGTGRLWLYRPLIGAVAADQLDPSA
jgi:16S rRNA (guanine966-N2)-methyltransferase